MRLQSQNFNLGGRFGYCLFFFRFADADKGGGVRAGGEGPVFIEKMEGGWGDCPSRRGGGAGAAKSEGGDLNIFLSTE